MIALLMETSVLNSICCTPLAIIFLIMFKMHKHHCHVHYLNLFTYFIEFSLKEFSYQKNHALETLRHFLSIYHFHGIYNFMLNNMIILPSYWHDCSVLHHQWLVTSLSIIISGSGFHFEIAKCINLTHIHTLTSWNKENKIWEHSKNYVAFNVFFFLFPLSASIMHFLFTFLNHTAFATYIFSPHTYTYIYMYQIT